MSKKVVIKAAVLVSGLVLIIWAIIVLQGNSEDLTDRNEYISERNKRICKYDVREVRISKPEGSTVAFKKMGNIWDGGNLSDEFIKTQLEEFCNLKVEEEADLERLKGDLEWIEDLEVVFVDGSSIHATLSQNGVIQIGIRHYFTPSLLKLIQGYEGNIPDVNIEPEKLEDQTDDQSNN